MIATIVTSDDELKQIVELSNKNLRANIPEEEHNTQGFTSWSYSLDLLRQLNAQQPHVIVKDNDKVIGYALVAMKSAVQFHPDLKTMIDLLESIIYKGKKLSAYHYYVIGQICVDHAYRGKGVFRMLYQEHKKLFERDHDFLITEISPTNIRSIRAHESVGFKTIYTHKDAVDKWNVVLWDWK
jgi:GNAT superfamily N-acetyltransferase